MKDLFKDIEKDVRSIEGLKASFSCGFCTDICPASEVNDSDFLIIGLQINQVEVEPLFDMMRIKHDPIMKYKGFNGEDLGKPEDPLI